MGKVLGWVAVAIIAIYFIGRYGGSSPSIATGSDTFMVAGCQKEGADKLAAIMALWTKGELIRHVAVGRVDGTRPAVVTVDERSWLAAPHDTKVTIAFAAFCQNMNADGRGALLVRGYRDGKTKASMTDGNYFDE